MNKKVYEKYFISTFLCMIGDIFLYQLNYVHYVKQFK